MSDLTRVVMYPNPKDAEDMLSMDVPESVPNDLLREGCNILIEGEPHEIVLRVLDMENLLVVIYCD